MLMTTCFRGDYRSREEMNLIKTRGATYRMSDGNDEGHLLLLAE